MSAAERYDERCPTCGRFVLDEGEGFVDLPPGGVQGIDYLTTYCNETCANRKQPPAIYEDTPEFDEFDRRWRERRAALRAKKP